VNQSVMQEWAGGAASMLNGARAVWCRASLCRIRRAKVLADLLR
jgi:hypothetical protein